MSASITAYIIIAIFGILACLSIVFTRIKKGRKAFIFAIYLIFFFYTIGQSVYYSKTQAGSSPDESAHISYVAYLHESGRIIPQYEVMRLISVKPLKWSEDLYEYIKPTCNYICHPPLYYYILNMSDSIHDTDHYHVYQIDKVRLRYVSLAIFSLGLLILLYIGFSRIPEDKPWLHLFFAAAVTCVPMLAFEGCAVTNDNMALLTGCTCILGLIRFSEKKRNILTYLLIAVGISASLLTKMTTALLCVMMALIVLFYTMIKEKSITGSLNKNFYVTIPVYAIALVYLGIIFLRYHTIQPSLEMVCSKEYFQSTIYYIDPSQRIDMDFKQYSGFYFTQFLLSWTGIVGNYGQFLKASVFTKAGLLMEALWIMPLLLLVPSIRKKSKALALPILSAYIACTVTVVIQFKSAWGTFLGRGYLGGSQARYYLPFIFAFALATCIGASTVYDNADCILHKHKKLARYLEYAVIAGMLFYAFALCYSNFPHFLIHFGYAIATLQ